MNIDPAPTLTSIRLFRSESWFDLANPTPEMVHLEDIAFGLSNVVRFAGQVRSYSVAQHSVLCARQAADANRLRMLLHDAGEAYAHDISGPLKRMLPAYHPIEARIFEAVRVRFGLEPGPIFVGTMKDIDNRMLRTEARDLMFAGQEPPKGYPEEPCYSFEIQPWPAIVAEEQFLYEYKTAVMAKEREEKLCQGQ